MPAPTCTHRHSAYHSPASLVVPARPDRWGCGVVWGTLGMGQEPQGPHHPQVLQDGACVPPEECRCTLDSTMPGVLNLSREEQEQEHAPGSRLQHRCNTWCVLPAPQHHPTAGDTELGDAERWVGAESPSLPTAFASVAPSTARRRSAMVRASHPHPRARSVIPVSQLGLAHSPCSGLPVVSVVALVPLLGDVWDG